MNLQIKKLLNKTSAYGPGGETMDRYNCSLNDLEKFAELIVLECTRVIERNLFQGIGWNTSRAVRQHFGMGDEE